MYMKPVCYPAFTFPPVTEQTEACGLFSDSFRLEPHPVHRLCLRKLCAFILSSYRKVLGYCLTLGYGRFFPHPLLFIISQLTLCVYWPTRRYWLILSRLNPLKPELNPIFYLLALLGAHHFLHVSRIRVKSLTFRRPMSYIYGAPILDVSRSHTTTQHSR